MKKKSKAMVALALTLFLSVNICLLSVLAESIPISDIDIGHTVADPYEYPVVPGMEEWAALTSLEERIAACHVDLSLLERMSTPALLETVLNYPLLVNIFAYPTPQEGIDAVSSYFSGLRVLREREDAAMCVNELVQGTVAQQASPSGSVDYDAVYRQSCLELLGEYVSTTNTPPAISTPGGTPVPDVEVNMTWEDHGISEDEARAHQNAFANAYTTAREISGINPSYNCHSYTFYSTATNNNYWINNINPYFSDGSYTQTSTLTSGDKMVWGSNEHSAIVDSVAGYTVYCVSKWGPYGVFYHPKTDCPYFEPITYWRR